MAEQGAAAHHPEQRGLTKDKAMITSSSSRVPNVPRRTTRLALAAALSFAGSVSVNDFTCFLSKFAAGCP